MLYTNTFQAIVGRLKQIHAIARKPFSGHSHILKI